MTPATERWWFDLQRGQAVRDDERGPAKDMLGPYPSKAAAENWRVTRDEREGAWREEDERWDGEPDEEGGAGPPA